MGAGGGGREAEGGAEEERAGVVPDRGVGQGPGGEGRAAGPPHGAARVGDGGTAERGEGAESEGRGAVEDEGASSSHAGIRATGREQGGQACGEREAWRGKAGPGTNFRNSGEQIFPESFQNVPGGSWRLLRDRGVDNRVEYRWETAQSLRNCRSRSRTVIRSESYSRPSTPGTKRSARSESWSESWNKFGMKEIL
ncbi:myosin IC heavy chain-like [Leucoraja erinacea]|uniref:myosin IC heavy chain-like n=1 Tax=Leucoraja erinaceus TaxID=7782 RepID=UPI002453BC3B|nr:myosin IC heavy chain-like [Leucoraja erinacea]